MDAHTYPLANYRFYYSRIVTSTDIIVMFQNLQLWNNFVTAIPAHHIYSSNLIEKFRAQIL
jgi:hypothetical protein